MQSKVYECPICHAAHCETDKRVNRGKEYIMYHCPRCGFTTPAGETEQEAGRIFENAADCLTFSLSNLLYHRIGVSEMNRLRFVLESEMSADCDDNVEDLDSFLIRILQRRA